MVYGCGAMGTRIASLASESGFEAVLAGRPSPKLTTAAQRLHVKWRGSTLTDPRELDSILNDVQIVINTAGPFVRTAAELMRACLRNECHYLDLSNEPATFQDAWSLDGDAREAGVVIVPGAGFGTAVTQALAARVLEGVNEADTLTIVRTSAPGAKSLGTARTTREILAQPGAGVTDGQWQVQGNRTVCFDLPAGRRTGVPVGLGDAFAVARATGIPQVRTYATITMNPLLARLALPLARRFIRAGRLGGWPEPRARSKAGPPGPDGIQVWIQAANPQGETAAGCIHGDSGNELAARIAVLAALQLMRPTTLGVITAGELVGSEAVLDLPGLRVTDL